MSDIEVLVWPEPVRRRPEMYIGSLDDPGVCNCFITEALCDSFDNIVSGQCSEVSITISPDRVTVANNGPGVSMRRDDDGTPLAQRLMTELFACRHMKANETIGKDICRNGIAVINALSSQCTVDNKTNGQHWQQNYTQGLPTSPFVDLGTTSESGFSIKFTPDAALIQSPSYDIPAFCNWLVGLRFTGGEAVLTIRDQQTNHTSVAFLTNGTFSLQSAG
ncbi:hypothetical protein N9B37_00785 [bacterium]|jgi:DNA gyrase subunit B|nr:hypothetical protein [Mariniblastus sp.]MDA7913350.1 hypothetical protein [bacterium]